MRQSVWMLAGACPLCCPGVSWALRSAAELFIERAEPAMRTRSALLGVIWRRSETLLLDAGVRFAQENNRAVRKLRAGLTWRLPAVG